MQKTAYLLLIILAILALLGGIAAEFLNENNISTWPVIAVWVILHLVGANAHRSTFNWSSQTMSELACGMALLYSSAQVIQNIALLPTVVLSFACATYLAALHFKEGER
jgi:hypothetical protein